jgi:hypothetical protein
LPPASLFDERLSFSLKGERERRERKEERGEREGGGVYELALIWVLTRRVSQARGGSLLYYYSDSLG